MLIEFSASNFKSFKNELIFSMVPAPKQKGLDYSILKEKIERKEYKGLSTAVIYGPNASGKTNIIEAMDVFKEIVSRGHIRNDDKDTVNPSSGTLELIPNVDSDKAEPVKLAIKFIDKGLFFEYMIAIDLGGFLNGSHERKIIEEKLFINERLIFSREPFLRIGEIDSIVDYTINGFEDNKASMEKISKENLIDDELFLANGFKNMFSSKLAHIITEWIEDKFLVFCRADTLLAMPAISNSKKDTVYIDRTVNAAAKVFGVNSNDLGYFSVEENLEPKLYSLLHEKGMVKSDTFESFGTVRFTNMFPLIVDSLLYGRTIVIDEFDASLHPMAVMSIINIFHNDEINKNNAQLIFNTHNPIFLNANLFRRDEIKFVEREDATYESIHYSLSDFGTSGGNAVRMGGDYMKNYFISRYGAIRDIDFTPILEQLLEERQKQEV